MAKILKFEQYVAIPPNEKQYFQIVKSVGGIKSKPISGRRKLRVDVAGHEVIVLIKDNGNPAEIVNTLEAITKMLRGRLRKQ